MRIVALFSGIGHKASGVLAANASRLSIGTAVPYCFIGATTPVSATACVLSPVSHSVTALIFCLATLQAAGDYRREPCRTDAAPRHEAQFVVTAHFDTPESENGRSKGPDLS
ncbi:hypothetical protein [Paracoccus sp. IB05]|uniref:hypothetical protein n=1 Tax=Paracoccus sp. IB05 TaxID=2779367 RepID=UPI0018E7F186|nr:hypothetical protein [Paracoccus sp. IB05]MBJ2152705.1 hypothetical protein [Paracoccus sp. IB05]